MQRRRRTKTVLGGAENAPLKYCWSTLFIIKAYLEACLSEPWIDNKNIIMSRWWRRLGSLSVFSSTLVCRPPTQPASSVLYRPALVSDLSLFLPSLLAYLHGADVREPLNGIMVAFLRNQREQTGFLGLGVPFITASSIRVPLSPSLFAAKWQMDLPLVLVTNPKEHVMAHQVYVSV